MKHVTLYAVALSVAVAAVSLGGCNSGEDFGDVTIGGPIIDNTPQPAPLPDDDEEAVEIELVVAKEVAGVVRTANIAHIKYKCTDSIGEVKASGDKAYLARCATSARSVEFFVGGTGPTDPRVSFGTAYLPMCTGRSEGSVGQAGCGGGSGFFQVAVADLVPRPFPLPDPIPLSAPARRLASDAEVRNRVALLTALDVSDKPYELKIASGANNLAGDAPFANFSVESYTAFQDYWQPWLTQISGTAVPVIDPPLAMPATAAQAEALAQAAMDRSRTGLFTLEYNPDFYVGLTANPELLRITLPFAVLPDGSVIGVGALQGVTNVTVRPEAAVDLLAIEAGARLDDSLRILGAGTGSWKVQSVLNPLGASNPSADLDFRGRIIGSAAYDNVTTDAGRNDYNLDYPDVLKYNLVAADTAKFVGSAYEYPQLENVPYKIARTGAVGAVLHASVMDALPDFYQITINMACVNDADPDCINTIPAGEIGPGLNYPVQIDNDNCDASCADDDPAVVITKEKPRGGGAPEFAFASGTFNVQFLADGSIITDRYGECRPLENLDSLVREAPIGTIQEYRVGYVSRTLPDSDSANVLLFMASSAAEGSVAATASVPPPMPHFGTQIQGRINLAEPEMPLLRLGDDNFAAGVRAFWQDFYQPGRYSLDYDTYTGTIGHTLQALASGAAAGVALDASCVPVGAVSPAP